jgi:hypothetical protein
MGERRGRGKGTKGIQERKKGGNEWKDAEKII